MLCSRHRLNDICTDVFICMTIHTRTETWKEIPSIRRDSTFLGSFPWQERALLAFWFGLGFANSLEIFTITDDFLHQIKVGLHV